MSKSVGRLDVVEVGSRSVCEGRACAGPWVGLR